MKMADSGNGSSKWKGGQLLAFSGLEGPTDYASGLTLRTSFAGPGLEVRLPAFGRIEFPCSVAADRNEVAADWFRLGSTIQGALVDAHHLLIEGPCTEIALDPSLVCSCEGDRALIGVASRFNMDLITTDLQALVEKRKAWLQGVKLPPGLPAARHRTLAKALSVMKTQVYSPEGRIRHRWTTPDRWPHRKMWLWDSVFHAIGWRHVNPELARSAIDAVLDMQAPDGFIAHMMDPNGTSRFTQPPVLALGVKAVQQVQSLPGWLETVYPKLEAYLEWDLAHRDRDGGGLVEWEIEGDPFCRSGESGMDNSPRFDTATQMDAVDFNSFLALECEIMAEFALQLGRPADTAKWQRRYDTLCQLIVSRLWSEAQGFFVDYDHDRKTPSSVLASSGFLPLICGAATMAQAEQLARLLQDPGMFGTVFPVPSIPVRDQQH